MSSRLAKSTSKFRPVKPQPKKQGTPTVSSSSAGVTPSASPAPPTQLASQQSSAVAPSSAPLSQPDHHDSSAVPAEVTRAVVAVATTDEDNNDNVQAPPPPTASVTPSIVEPTLEAPSSRHEEPTTSAQFVISDSPALPTTQIPQVTRPKPKRIPSVIPRSSPLRKRLDALALSAANEPPPSSTPEAQLTVPVQPSSSSSAVSSSSRQGTPLSVGGSSFAAGSSWQALEGATQVSASPSSQSPAIPGSQATVVASSSSQKEAFFSKEARTSEKGTTVAEPTSIETRTQQTVEISPVEISPVEPPPQTSASTSISRAAPPPSTPLPAAQPLPPLSPGHIPGNDDENGRAHRLEEDDDGEGEAEPGGSVPLIRAEGAVERETVITEAPAKKKRGRPPGSGRGTAKGKKATGSRSGSQSSRGAESENGRAEGEEAEGNAGIESDDEGETALDAPVKKKRKTSATAKRKVPSKSATKKSSKKKKPTPVEGGQNAEEDDEEEEYDENGELIYEPWEISKLHPGYSLNTRDIYAAVGIEIPESFAFTTAQDIAEFNEEEEDEEEGLQGGDDTREGFEDDEANVEDGEQAEEEYREEEEENGEGGTTPWQPFGKAVDPTMTTMRQLTEDTGRGRITPKLVKNMTDKIDRKQMLKWAREKMKLRQSLRKAGLDPEAIERRLDEHMHALMHGSGVVEFTEGDRSVPTGHLIAPNRQQTEEAASVHGYGDDRSRNGTPYDGDISAQPLFRPEGNSDEEGDGNASRHFEDEDRQDRGEEYDEDGYEGMMETQFAPQMRFVDGQFVLDEASTQIVRDNAAREGFAIVEDTTDSRRITSASWGKRGKASRWTMADTDLFYEGLTQFGTDFELISRMFSNRTRRQIKAKFVREEKIDSARLEEALSGKKKIDINFYERMTKVDFRNGMVPADPMAKFYDGLPTADSAVKLESNREPSPSQELDLAALLRKKKEDTAGPGGWENSRAPQEYDGYGQDAIPEEENGGEEGEQYEEQHGYAAEDGHDEEMEGQYEHEEVGYRSPTPQQQDEPFDFSGGIQLRVSG